MIKFEVFKRWGLRGPRWYFRIRAGNGEPIAQSEGYKNKADAFSAIDLLRHFSSRAEIDETGQ